MGRLNMMSTTISFETRMEASVPEWVVGRMWASSGCMRMGASRRRSGQRWRSSSTSPTLMRTDHPRDLLKHPIPSSIRPVLPKDLPFLAHPPRRSRRAIRPSRPKFENVRLRSRDLVRLCRVAGRSGINRLDNVHLDCEDGQAWWRRGEMEEDVEWGAYGELGGGELDECWAERGVEG